jgi:hypothetical protein
MIERYAQAILTPWLHSKKLPALAIASMANDVRARLHSALSGWSEANRATLLMPAREEATFYEPRSASLDVRALVVLCIRDSKIEDWFSTGSGLAEPLHDAAVRELTAAAIAYFSKQPAAAFAALAVSPDLEFGNVFGRLPDKYPAAWRALEMLVSLSTSVRGIQFKPVVPRRPSLDWPASQGVDERLVSYLVTLSGMAPFIDSGMAVVLQQLEQGHLSFFFSNNFKMITRNLDKLLSIIEFVLACGKPLVTLNYYLSNGLVLQRDRLCRPAHTRRESENQLLDRRVLQGVEMQHQVALRSARDIILQEA